MPSEVRGFAPEVMVRCEECLRPNPPTRASCLYCAAALTVDEKLTDLRNPSLSPVENSVQGYNTILLPQPANILSTEVINSAASLLHLPSGDVKRIVDFGVALPLARTATSDDALLISGRLKTMGISSVVVSDEQLLLKESPPAQIRGLIIDERGMTPKLSVGDEAVEIGWDNIELIVTGRRITKRVESKERKGRRGEGEIVDANEFFADDAIMDVYSKERNGNLRLLANSFDFSCLEHKSLVAAENFRLLLNFIRQSAPHAQHDDSYNSIRQVLGLVWPSDQQTGSRGWSRERPGKYSVEAVTVISNEIQFTRYSRLRYLMKIGLNTSPGNENQ